MSDAATWTLEFDGACADNGRPDARGGFGWQIRKPSGEVLSSGYGPVWGDPVTNNVAEYWAVIEGVRWLSSFAGFPADAVLVVRGDSKLVLETLAGRWKCKKPHLAVLRDRALELLAKAGCDWRVKWVPREENDECDYLSQMGLGEKNAWPVEYNDHMRAIGRGA